MSTSSTSPSSTTNNDAAVTQKLHSLYEGIIKGERRAVSKAITLVESSLPSHRDEANRLLEMVLRFLEAQKSAEKTESGAILRVGRTIQPQLRPATKLRIGISGPPGVGKSTFIESFGLFLIERVGMKVAVLSIDPSSHISGGSILGDKTRMEKLSNSPEAYVRPSPSRCTLGGVAQDTAESLILCEAAGFDIVIVETVGVGQSEVTVSQTVDFLILLVSPGGGDDLQGIKRGIMELSDLIVVNKADGDLLPQAKRTKADYQHALRFLRTYNQEWPAKVMLSSTVDTSKEYMLEIWEKILDFEKTMTKTNGIQRRRAEQRQQWMWHQLQEDLLMRLRRLPQLSSLIETVLDQLRHNKMTPRIGARQVIDSWLSHEVDTRRMRETEEKDLNDKSDCEGYPL